jgi:hypothetical protein
MFERIKSYFGRAGMSAPAPLSFAASKTPLYSEQAYYHMLQFFGTVPDPDDMLRQIGIARWQLRQLEIDPEVSGRLEDRVSSLIATPWTLEPTGTRAAKFVAGQLGAVLKTFDRATVSAVAYGYSMPEVTYKKLPAGKTGIASVSEKPIEWFSVDAETGWWNYHPDDGSGNYLGTPCDPRKFFPIVRNPSTRNPYGESILSRLYFPVKWRHEGFGMRMNFMDAFGSPIIIANVKNYQGFVDAMKAQGVRSVVAWQGGTDDKVTTIQPSTAGEFTQLDLALTRMVQTLILGNTMTTDGGTYGSRASGEVGLKVEDSRRLSDIQLCSEAVQALVNVLCDLNGFQPLIFQRRDETGIEAGRAARDANLAPVLQTSGLQYSRSYFMDNYGLDETDLEPAVAAPQQSAQPANGPAGTATFSAKALTFAPASEASAQFTEAQQAVEDLGDEAMGQAGEFAIDPEHIKDAVRQSSDRADLERRLLRLFQDREKHSDLFLKTLTMADFAAQVLGYVAAEEKKS